MRDADKRADDLAEEYALKMGAFVKDRTDGKPTTTANVRAVAEMNAKLGFLAGRQSLAAKVEALKWDRDHWARACQGRAEEHRQHLEDKLALKEELRSLRAKVEALEKVAEACDGIPSTLRNSATLLDDEDVDGECDEVREMATKLDAALAALKSLETKGIEK